MTLRTGLACVGLLSACSFVFVGCGDDEPAGGSGSNGGKGGSSGKGGTSGTSGTAGGAARGGTAGRGGSAGQGGTAGSSGSAGQDMGGVGGEGGEGGASGAGMGPGGAGAGGEGGTPDTTADSCTYQCVDDDDCVVGMDTSHKCHPTRKRCERPELVCAAHGDCAALASGWTEACADDSECILGLEACINAGGRGLCAFTPQPKVGCFTGAEMTMPRFGATGDTTVCGSDAGRCDDKGRCFTGCTDSSAQCTLARGRGTTCNATTGLCECTADVQCSADGVSSCNMTTHQCECVDSGDCTVTGTDECVSGRCGCSSSSVCPATTFPLATAVCE